MIMDFAPITQEVRQPIHHRLLLQITIQEAVILRQAVITIPEAIILRQVVLHQAEIAAAVVLQVDHQIAEQAAQEGVAAQAEVPDVNFFLNSI